MVFWRTSLSTTCAVVRGSRNSSGSILVPLRFVGLASPTRRGGDTGGDYCFLKFLDDYYCTVVSHG